VHCSHHRLTGLCWIAVVCFIIGGCTPAAPPAKPAESQPAAPAKPAESQPAAPAAETKPATQAQAQPPAPAQAQPAASAAQSKPAAKPGATPLKVAYLPCGRINDQSWSQVGYEGVIAAQKELGIDVAYSESTPAADVEAAARDYASKGYGLILLHCGTFSDAAYKAAKDFPSVWFEASAGDHVDQNVFAYDPQQQEGTFMAGAVAGLTTKTNKLGAVVAFNFAGFNRQHEGFRLGARFVNPNVDMFVTYINSLEDAAKAKEAALAQFDAGADIILASTDQAISGIIQAAEERKGLVVAQYADQNHLAPNLMLESVTYKQDKALTDVIRRVAGGSMKGEFVNPGLKDGVGQVALNMALGPRLSDDARSCLNLLQQSFTDGKLHVPATEALGKDGSGKTIDTKSVIEGGSHPCLNKRP
jgi:basic membrane protein A